MKLKSLSNKELEDKILWSKVDHMVRSMEARYEGQSEDERRKEYEGLHAIYRTYWDEAFRRGMVERHSENISKYGPPTE